MTMIAKLNQFPKEYHTLSCVYSSRTERYKNRPLLPLPLSMKLIPSDRKAMDFEVRGPNERRAAMK